MTRSTFERRQGLGLLVGTALGLAAWALAGPAAAQTPLSAATLSINAGDSTAVRRMVRGNGRSRLQVSSGSSN